MSKCWYCNEELTTANYCDKHIGICTRCYASMFKVGNEFVKGLTDKIADLETKLAEVKNSCDYYMKRSNDLVCEIGEYKKHIRFKGKEIVELKQQLAEKENTITTLIEDSKASKELLKKEIEELKAQRHIYLTRSVDECNKITMLELELQHKDQDKISFALEQLKKVKNGIESKIKSIYKRLDDLNIKIVCETTSMQLDTYKEISKEIDNQIKAIKGDEVV